MGDSATTDQDVALTLPAAALLANDSDPDGGTLSILSVSAGVGGTPVLNGDGSVTFTPDAGFSGAASFTYTLSDGQGGTDTATVDVTVVAAPTGPVTRATISEIQADGWRATDSAPVVFDPVGAPDYVVAEGPGHDALGNAITLRRDIPIMARVRQPYPNQASPTANDVALAEHVYAGDTVAGVTNTSTLAYRKPVCCWLKPDSERVSGTYTARLAVAHWEARSERAVAAVVFSATDGVTTVTQLVTASTPVTYSASGLTVDAFEGALDLSTLSEGLVTIDAEIRPWVGPAWTASQDFATYPSINFCDMRVFNVKTAAEAPIYAYVDPAGDNGTGVASPTVTTAQASPFLTVAAAAAAVQAVDGANASRGVLRLNAGTYTHANFSSVAVGDTPLVIEATNPANKATTIYQDAGASVSNGCPDKLRFKDLTLHKTGGSVIFIDNSAGLGSSNMVVLDGVSVTGSGSYGAWFYRTGRLFAVNSDLGAVGVARAFSSVNKTANLIGCAGGGNWNTAYSTVAARLDGGILDNAVLQAANREAPDGQLIAASFLSNATSGNPGLNVDAVIGAGGLALVGTIVEDQDGGASSAAYLGADGATDPMQNVLVQGCTFVGQRLNFLYNDTTPYAAKTGQIRFSAIKLTNTKSDVFAADATAVGNWSVIHKVGWRSNAYLDSDSQGNGSYGPGNWIGEFAALGDLAGFGAVLDPDWADDQSAAGGGAGGGDYAPGGSTALPTYGDAALLPYATDQSGAALSAASHIGAIG